MTGHNNHEDEEIRKMLEGLLEEDIEKLEREIEEKPEPEYSKEFEMKMKSLAQKEKLFHRKGKNHAMRWVVVAFFMVSALLMAGTASAKLFGFEAWAIAQKLTKKGNGKIVTYQRKETDKEEKIVRPVYDEPQYIPEGFEEIKRSGKMVVHVIWGNKDIRIQYIKEKITEGMEMSYKNNTAGDKWVTVGEIDVYWDLVGDRTGITWCDDCYLYQLERQGDHAEEVVSDRELKEMIKSMY